MPLFRRVSSGRRPGKRHCELKPEFFTAWAVSDIKLVLVFQDKSAKWNVITQLRADREFLPAIAPQGDGGAIARVIADLLVDIDAIRVPSLLLSINAHMRNC
jgi:hypothetical protein